MAFNPFVMKKWGALFLVGFVCIIAYVIGMVMYNNFFYGLIFFACGLVISILIANMLLTNPFTKMLEGKGILCLNIDSTGIITPFIVKVIAPYIKGKIGKEPVNDVFNRDTTMSLKPPRQNGTATFITEGENRGGLKIELNEETYNQGRFGLFHYPVIIYNQQIKSLLTKDFISGMEKDAFAEHGVLYLNRKMEELTSVLRDFARYVVETIKPKGSIFGSKWVIIIIVILIIVLLAMFAPAIIQQISGFMGEGSIAIGKAKTATITPV